MRYAFTLVLLAFQFFAFTQAPKFLGEELVPKSSEALTQQFGEYYVYRIDPASLNQYAKEAQGTRPFVLELGARFSWDIEISAYDFRAPGYRVYVATENGIEVAPETENKSFRGKRTDDPLAAVSLTLDHEFIYGYVEEGEETYFIEPLWYFQPDAAKDLFVVYPASKVIPVEGKFCGATEMKGHMHGPGELDDFEGVELTGNCYRVELAIASDWLMFQAYGSIVAVQNHNIGVMNNVNTNYDTEFSDEINFFIVEQFVSTCSTCDPWTSSTDPEVLLDDFTAWGPTGFNATHDLGQLWTDRDLDGSVIGIAWLGAVCTPDRYHVLQDFTNNANLLRVVAAHEIGHNFNATHDPAGSPTIMAPAVNNTNDWSTQSENEINAFLLFIDPPGGCLSFCPPPAPPIPAFTANITMLCTGSFVTFFDESTNQPSSWSWSMPGATPSTSTERSPTVVYNNNGVYSVTLIVTNSNGSNTLTKNAYINVVAAGGTDFFFFEGFENGQGNWTIQNPDNNSSWVNMTVNGTRQGTKAMMIDNFNYNAPGQRDALISPTISLFGRNNAVLEIEYAYARYNASRRDSLIVYISTNNGSSYTRLFAATENGNLNFATKADQTVAFNPQTMSEWCFGTGGPNCLSLSLAAYANQPNCKIKIENYNGHGNRMFIDNVRLLSNCEVLIPPTANFIGVPTNGCAPLQVNFQDQSLNVPMTWLWSFPGALPPASTLQNPVVLYQNPGTYTVTLTVSNPAGANTITKTNYITVGTTPVAQFSYVVNGTTVTFTNTSSANSTTFSWNFGDGTSSSQQNPPPHVYPGDGAYVVILTVTNPCGTSIFPQTIVIQTPPVAGFTASPTSGCDPLVVQFTDESSNNVSTWSWTFPGGNPGSSTLENPVVTYLTPGTYSVSLTVTNSQGSNSVSQSNLITVEPSTTAGFTFVTDGNEVTFTNSSVNATSYLWDFGDGNTGTETNPVHLYSADGTYDVSLTAYGACDTIVVTQTVVVETTQAPEALFSADTTEGCTPFTVHFSDQSVHAPASWSWTFQGGTPATSNVQNPVVQYLNPGIFGVTLTVTNSAGTDTYSDPAFILVEVGPTAGFTWSVNGTIVTFTNTSSNSTGYSWDFGDGNTSTQTNPTHDFLTDGAYNVVLTATNDCGPDTFGVVIEIVTPPTAGFSANVTEGCVPLTVQFSNESSENADSWSWTFAGGTPGGSNQSDPVVEYLNPGTYGVTLTVTNEAGNDTYSISQYITVSGLPAAGFSYVISSGSTVTFTNGSSNADTWFWDFGDGATSTEEDPEHVYPGDGTYVVELISTGECGSDTTSQEIVIITPPLAGFSADMTQGCVPFTVQFSNESSENAVSWSWTFEGGTPGTSAESDPIVEYLIPGTYGVTLTVSNPAGSDTLSFSQYISVYGLPVAGFSYVISSGSTVTFTNSSVNTNLYYWDFGDGTSSTETDPVNVFPGDGTYTVQLISFGECGSDTTSQVIVIVTPPLANFSADVTEGCAPLTVQFTNESSANAISWSWTFEGGVPAASNEQNPLVEFPAPGFYNVTLTVSNSAGEDTETIEDFIHVLDVPVAAFTPAVNGTSVQFTNNSSDAVSFQWDFGDGNISTESDPLHIYADDGIYTVELIAINPCGADTVTTEVEIILAPTAGFSADPTEGCAPLQVQFTDLSTGNATSWSWAFEGGTPATSTQQNPLVTYLLPGDYGVTLTAGNTEGEGIAVFEDYITVFDVPAAGFDASVAGANASFTNTSVNAMSYSWDFGDGNGSTESDPQHGYAQDGTYTVVLTAENDCGTDIFTMDVVILTPPVAGFTANETEGCTPFIVQFQDLSSANATTWQWQFEGGSPSVSTLQNPVVQYLNPGTYGVTLTAGNSAGSDTISFTDFITVLPDPTAGFSVSVNGAIASFTNSSSNGVSYIWDFGDGVGSTAVNPQHTYSEDGVYTVHLTAINGCGSNATTQLVVVATSGPLALFVGSPVTGCAPLTVTFDNLSSSNAESFEWSFPGGNPSSSTGFEPVVEYAVPGVYDVTLTAYNINGDDSYVLTSYIEVFPTPVAGFTYSIMNGATVQFSNTSTNVTSWTWNFGDGNTGNTENPVHTYTQTGVFNVVLIAESNCGTSQFTLPVIINAAIPTAAFSATPADGCAPLTVQFTDQSTGNPSQWNWSFPGGEPPASTDPDPVVVYNAAGQYTATLQVSNAAGSDVLMQSEMIVVSDIPVTEFTYQELPGFEFVFTNTSFGADTFQWDFGDGQTSILTSAAHVYAEPGTYTVTLTATNECGSGVAEMEIVVSSVEEAGLFEKLLVFPNPNDGSFTVWILAPEAANEAVQLRLVNGLGQVVMEQESALTGGELKLFFGQSGLAGGLYWLEIHVGDQRIAKKLVVE